MKRLFHTSNCGKNLLSSHRIESRYEKLGKRFWCKFGAFKNNLYRGIVLYCIVVYVLLLYSVELNCNSGAKTPLGFVAAQLEPVLHLVQWCFLDDSRGGGSLIEHRLRQVGHFSLFISFALYRYA